MPESYLIDNQHSFKREKDEHTAHRDFESLFPCNERPL